MSKPRKQPAPPQQGEFLSDIRGEALSEILAAAEIIEMGAEQVIIREGTQPSYVFLLKSGRAKFYRLSHSGDEVLLSLLVPGDTFGLGTLLTRPVPYIGTAETTRASELIVWKQARIRRLAQKHNRLAQNALAIVLRYLTVHFDRLFDIVASTASERIAGAIIHLCKQTGTLSPSGVEIDATNEELAAHANVSPFTVSRSLHAWENRGALHKSRGKVFVKSPEKLLG